MGESGAGKTTLLNVLASRTSIGVVSGEKLVDAKFQNEGFARKIGYAQQHGIAMPTATVKETLVFYARLRQSSEYTDEEKLAYVEEVIATLDLSELADAVVGVSGGRLNIEQRKRLTIEIELAARPELLLFLDEPNSGLDSNTAWSICALLRKLADAGQTILCTIHQPSGTAFEMFDRLLFIKEGRTIYSGHWLQLSDCHRLFQQAGSGEMCSARKPCGVAYEYHQSDRRQCETRLGSNLGDLCRETRSQRGIGRTQGDSTSNNEQ